MVNIEEKKTNKFKSVTDEFRVMFVTKGVMGASEALEEPRTKEESIALGPARAASASVRPNCPLGRGATALPLMINVVLYTALGGGVIRGGRVSPFTERDMAREYALASSRKYSVREKEDVGFKGKTEKDRGEPITMSRMGSLSGTPGASEGGTWYSWWYSERSENQEEKFEARCWAMTWG